MAECEAAVVPAAAHAEPVTGAVEAHQRRDDQAHLSGVEQGIGGEIRFGDAVPIADQRVARTPRGEAELAILMQDRQAVHAFTR
jgi:hypothetical protein